MFDEFPDVLVLLDVWISAFWDFWIPRRLIQCCSPSVLLMFDLVDVSGAARLESVVILSLGLFGLL